MWGSTGRISANCSYAVPFGTAADEDIVCKQCPHMQSDKEALHLRKYDSSYWQREIALYTEREIYIVYVVRMPQDAPIENGSML